MHMQQKQHTHVLMLMYIPKAPTRSREASGKLHRHERGDSEREGLESASWGATFDPAGRRLHHKRGAHDQQQVALGKVVTRTPAWGWILM